MLSRTRTQAGSVLVSLSQQCRAVSVKQLLLVALVVMVAISVLFTGILVWMHRRARLRVRAAALALQSRTVPRVSPYAAVFVSVCV